MSAIIAVITAVKNTWDLAGEVARLILLYIEKKRMQRRLQKLDEAFKKADMPEKSLEQGRQAACEIEKVFNPDSRCSSGDPRQ